MILILFNEPYTRPKGRRKEDFMYKRAVKVFYTVLYSQPKSTYTCIYDQSSKEFPLPSSLVPISGVPHRKFHLENGGDKEGSKREKDTSFGC